MISLVLFILAGESTCSGPDNARRREIFDHVCVALGATRPQNIDARPEIVQGLRSQYELYVA